MAAESENQQIPSELVRGVSVKLWSIDYSVKKEETRWEESLTLKAATTSSRSSEARGRDVRSKCARPRKRFDCKRAVARAETGMKEART